MGGGAGGSREQGLVEGGPGKGRAGWRDTEGAGGAGSPLNRLGRQAPLRGAGSKSTAQDCRILGVVWIMGSRFALEVWPESQWPRFLLIQGGGLQSYTAWWHMINVSENQQNGDKRR